MVSVHLLSLPVEFPVSFVSKISLTKPSFSGNNIKHLLHTDRRWTLCPLRNAVCPPLCSPSLKHKHLVNKSLMAIQIPHCHGRLFCMQNPRASLSPRGQLFTDYHSRPPSEQGYRLILNTIQMLMSAPTNAPVELDSLSVPELYTSPTASSHEVLTTLSLDIVQRMFASFIQV